MRGATSNTSQAIRDFAIAGIKPPLSGAFLFPFFYVLLFLLLPLDLLFPCLC